MLSYPIVPCKELKWCSPSHSITKRELAVYSTRCRFAFFSIRAEKRLPDIANGWSKLATEKRAAAEMRHGRHRRAVDIIEHLRQLVTPFELVTTLAAVALFAIDRPERFATPTVLHRSAIRSLFALHLCDKRKGDELPTAVRAMQTTPEAQALVVEWLTDVAGTLADDVANAALIP